MSFELFMFIVTASIALVGGIGMIVLKNTVHSALFLLLNFSAISVLFLLLQAPFLFAIQLTIYAGAIMVLFLFVVMLLGSERIEDTSEDRLAGQRWLALVLALVLLGQSVFLYTLTATGQPPTQDEERIAVLNSPASIGAELFTTYLLPFQITGIILLVGIIGVVVLNQQARQIPWNRRPEPEGDTGTPEG